MMLDDHHEIARIDAGGMLGLIGRLGPMLLEGWEAASDVAEELGERRQPAVIVPIGMGGSGIGGDILRALMAPASRIPCIVVKDERLPAFVGPETLVFACSYSGNTEETLAAFETAVNAGAQVVGVTSGGRLQERAAAAGHPVVRLPGGLPPRAALPYMLAPLLRMAASIGLLGASVEPDVREAAAASGELARRWGPDVAAASNAAKTLAATLRGAIPVIYAAAPGLEPVAQRWKTQLNENSKAFAVWNTFPELNHNETVGWEGVTPDSPPLSVIILRDRDEGARSAARVEATKALSLQRAQGVAEIWSQGDRRLARLLSLILFGDFVSAYLAVLLGVDPTPTESIARVKQRLQRA